MDISQWKSCEYELTRINLGAFLGSLKYLHLASVFRLNTLSKIAQSFFIESGMGLIKK